MLTSLKNTTSVLSSMLLPSLSGVFFRSQKELGQARAVVVVDRGQLVHGRRVGEVRDVMETGQVSEARQAPNWMSEFPCPYVKVAARIRSHWNATFIVLSCSWATTV
jgi:hypothetical protein